MARCGHLRRGRGKGVRLKILVDDGAHVLSAHIFPGHRTIDMYRRMFQFYREFREAPRRVYKS